MTITPPFDPQTLTPEQADYVLRAFRFGDLDCCADLGVLQRHPVAMPVAGRLLAEPGAPDELLYAAAVVWLSLGVDPAPLQPLLTQPNSTIRAIAAIGCSARGDLNGLKVLVEFLTIDDLFGGCAPRTDVWSLAARVLVSLTARADLGPSLDSDPSMRQAAVLQWRAVLNSGSATFDPGTGRWTTA
jgi:hypothetical protein